MDPEAPPAAPTEGDRINGGGEELGPENDAIPLMDMAETPEKSGKSQPDEDKKKTDGRKQVDTDSVRLYYRWGGKIQDEGLKSVELLFPRSTLFFFISTRFISTQGFKFLKF